MSDIIKYETDNGKEITLSKDIIRNQITTNKSVTDQEINYFMAMCKSQKLDPFVKDAYLIKYKNAPAQMIVSKDAFMKRAESNPQYDGFEAGVVVQGRGGKLTNRTGSLVAPGENLIGGWCNVYRKDRTHPTSVSVTLSEYSTGKSSWAKMPNTMIRKVAMVQALREAFPDVLQGLYTSEEMEQAAPIEVTDEATPHQSSQSGSNPGVHVHHDMTPLTELKHRLAHALDTSEDEAGKIIMDIKTKRFNEMTADEFMAYLDEVDEYVSGIEEANMSEYEGDAEAEAMEVEFEEVEI